MAQSAAAQLFTSLLLFLLLRTSTADKPYWWRCYGDGNYTANSTYQANLNQLLTYLSSNTHLTGFSNASFGSGSNRVYGLALCTGGVSPSDCHDSLLSAAVDGPQLCPYRKVVNIWLSNCHLRYSNKLIYSFLDSQVYGILYNVKSINDSEFTRFNLSVVTLLSNLVNIALHNLTTPPLYATGEMVYESKEYPKLYGQVQCTRDITKAECYQCLQDVIQTYLSCSDCIHRIGKRYIAGSCTFGCEADRLFYNDSGSVLYPAVNSGNQSPPPSTTALPPAGLNKTTEIPLASDSRKKATTAIIAASVAAGVLLLSVTYICFHRRKRKRTKVDAYLQDITTIESLLFDWHTIKHATNNFSPANKLGEGGNGSVYKGVLPDTKEIAVKRPRIGSLHGLEHLKNEVVILAKLHHRNLVKLLGVCLEGDEKLLVYEYVPNKSLEEILFDTTKKTELTWEKRKTIVEGIARGLLYLHEESRVNIIHRDLKASNILLDADMNPKISDFGTARLFTGDQTQVTTKNLVGTFGYMAPEYVTTGRFSEKSDVFSFGILVLEIVTGQRSWAFGGSSTSSTLTLFVWERWRRGLISEIVDPSLEGGFHHGDVMKCIQIALLCVQEMPTARPSMSTISLMLDGDSESIHVPIRPTFPGGYGYNVMEPDLPRAETEMPSETVSLNTVSISEYDPR